MITEAMLSLIRIISAQWVKLVDRWIAIRIAGNPGYDFTVEYCSNFTSDWEKYIGEYRGRENVKFLEIGCFEGRSTLWFLENILIHSTASITCIDSFVRRGGEPRFDHNLRVGGFTEKVTKIKGKSCEVLPTLKNDSFDVIYIDGSHLALSVLMDAVLSWLMLKPGGIIIFDDYAWETQRPLHARPQLAIDIFLEAFQAQTELMHKGYQVIVRKAYQWK